LPKMRSYAELSIERAAADTILGRTVLALNGQATWRTLNRCPKCDKYH